MANISMLPKVIMVSCPAGGSLAFSIGVTHADGTPFDFTGYTVTAPIRAPAGITPPVAALDVAVTDVGMLTLQLAADQTGALGAVALPVWPWSLWMQMEATKLQLVEGSVALAH